MPEKNLHYAWTYFTKGTNKTYVMCKICDTPFFLRKNYNKIMLHIRSTHSSDNNYYSTVTSKVSNSKRKKSKRPFFMTEDNQAKCDFCKKSFNICYTISDKMKNHLKTIHKIDKNTEQKHRILCRKYVKRNSLNNTMTCNYCNQVFQNNNYFTLMIHLTDAHEIDVSLKIRSIGLNDGSSCLPNIEVNDIVTSSCLSNTEVNDIVTSNSLFDTEVNDIVTSSTYQQTHTTYSFEYNSNNSSKSNKNAENIATLSSYQQPTFSSDDSFNCDDYDNIDNFDSLAEECLKEVKKIKRFDYDNIDNFDSLAEECLKEVKKIKRFDYDNIDNFDSLAEECLKEVKKIKRF